MYWRVEYVSVVVCGLYCSVRMTVQCIICVFCSGLASGSSIQSCSTSRLHLAHLEMSLPLEILYLIFGVQTDNHYECFLKWLPRVVGVKLRVCVILIR